MKYKSLLLDFVVAIALLLLGIYFYSKNNITLTIILIALGITRLDITNLYWKIKYEEIKEKNRNGDKKS